jgi:hypothetical protein
LLSRKERERILGCENAQGQRQGDLVGG